MKYIILQSIDIEKVDFSKVKQEKASSVRFSIDKQKFILKYDGDQPEFVYWITENALGLREYNHEEILNILNGPEWKSRS